MTLARLGLGLSALGALAWFLWPTDSWKFEPEPAIAFGTALILWLGAEWKASSGRPAHPHDVKLVRALMASISLEDSRYLKQQDFGAAYNNERLDGFWKIEWEAHAPGYGPHDPVLKKRFDAFLKKVRELSLLLAENGGPIGASACLCTIVPDRERVTDEFSDRTTALVKRVNNLADEVTQLYESLIKTARSRVPQAFGDEQ